jgi:hypothetical protein
VVGPSKKEKTAITKIRSSSTEATQNLKERINYVGTIRMTITILRIVGSYRKGRKGTLCRNNKNKYDGDDKASIITSDNFGSAKYLVVFANCVFGNDE